MARIVFYYGYVKWGWIKGTEWLTIAAGPGQQFCGRGDLCICLPRWRRSGGTGIDFPKWTGGDGFGCRLK